MRELLRGIGVMASYSKEMPEHEDIATRACPSCPLCAGKGSVLHSDLRDRLAPRMQTWNFVRCLDPACSALWLDPMPVEGEIGKAYHTDYYTHRRTESSAPWYRNLGRWVKLGYLSRRFGYQADRVSRLQGLLGLSIFLVPRLRNMI